jgi:hypothetical protein
LHGAGDEAEGDEGEERDGRDQQARCRVGKADLRQHRHHAGEDEIGGGEESESLGEVARPALPEAHAA